MNTTNKPAARLWSTDELNRVTNHRTDLLADLIRSALDNETEGWSYAHISKGAWSIVTFREERAYEQAMAMTQKGIDEGKASGASKGVALEPIGHLETAIGNPENFEQLALLAQKATQGKDLYAITLKQNGWTSVLATCNEQSAHDKQFQLALSGNPCRAVELKAMPLEARKWRAYLDNNAIKPQELLLRCETTGAYGKVKLKELENHPNLKETIEDCMAEPNIEVAWPTEANSLVEITSEAKKLHFFDHTLTINPKANRDGSLRIELHDEKGEILNISPSGLAKNLPTEVWIKNDLQFVGIGRALEAAGFMQQAGNISDRNTKENYILMEITDPELRSEAKLLSSQEVVIETSRKATQQLISQVEVEARLQKGKDTTKTQTQPEMAQQEM